MKCTTLMVLGGLAFAGVTLAAEPTPQNTAPGTSVKIGIDAKTGKRRQLTAEESAALDAQANNLRAKSFASRAKAGPSAPASYEESIAGAVSKNGLTIYAAPLESYSHITMTRDTSGKMVMLEDGQPMPAAKELASE